ncbi:MAG: hypothetical protein ACLT8A_15345 [Subdoligranulum sp.]
MAIDLPLCLGNAAQFPPDGLSTAPAAAARHLRCQNARYCRVAVPTPCFGAKSPRTLRPLLPASLFPPLAALTLAASSIICAFGLASAAPRSPYRHLELCGIALIHPPLFPFSPLLFFFIHPFCFPAFHLSAHLLFQQTCNKKRAHQAGGRGKSAYRIF